MKKILMVGAEAMPFAATGGLGDVLGSLPAALAAEGADVRVVLPLYGTVSPKWRLEMKQEAVFYVHLSWREQYCGVLSLKKDGVTYYFIDNEYYFKRPALYGYYDDGERYAFFCMAVLSMMEKIKFFPDVLHANDWQAASTVIYLERLFRKYPEYAGIRSVFTIHNIEYQGCYDMAILGDVFALGESDRGVVEYGGCINLMKGAIECADRVTTVSPRYAEEIRSPEYAHGLENCLNRNAFKLCGILNGIDYAYYDPKTDPDIAANFSARGTAGKAKDKTAMQKEAGLPLRADIPLLSVISRLASHKGLDILAGCIFDLVREQDIQLVILGKGEERFENAFRELQRQFPEKVSAMITYDRALSKRIYAATDIFLMPSRSEPCGLSQMIASRYGAIPVVRETGGLYDSIKPYWEDESGVIHGNGFTFADYRSDVLKERTEAAIALWKNADLRRKFVKQIMTTDFSWGSSAKRYLELFESL